MNLGARLDLNYLARTMRTSHLASNESNNAPIVGKLNHLAILGFVTCLNMYIDSRMRINKQ